MFLLGDLVDFVGDEREQTIVREGWVSLGPFQSRVLAQTIQKVLKIMKGKRKHVWLPTASFLSFLGYKYWH